jgi:hypothetical protein
MVLTAALVSGCNSTSAPTGPSTAPPSAAATPPGYTATPVPFNLTQTRTFDILASDTWPSAPAPSAVQFRWNATIGKYEVLAPGYGDWSRLEALPSPFGGTPTSYDIFGSGGTKLLPSMALSAPPHVGPPALEYVGYARLFDRSFLAFAFGIWTAPGDVPVHGTRTCYFGEDEIGDGELTFDLARGTVTGSVAPFWGHVRYPVVKTSFAPGATTFAVTFGTDGVLEGRFFGPRAVNVAVRAQGGGEGHAALSGIMTGLCEG